MKGCRVISWLTGSSRAELMDRGLRPLHEAGPRRALEPLLPCLTGRVLDVGCGTGAMFDLYPAGCRVLAIDINEEWLSLARVQAAEAPAHIDVVAGDVQRLALGDACCDAAIVQLVMCSVGDVKRGLAEIVRVVKPGGLLYFYEHVRSRTAWYRVIQDVTAPLWCWLSEGCHWNRGTDAAIRALPIEIEEDDRLRLQRGLTPPLPIVRIVARRRAPAS
jgi:SAM-dependent methyltransferase